jgi:hypothetical protein
MKSEAKQAIRTQSDSDQKAKQLDLKAIAKRNRIDRNADRKAKSNRSQRVLKTIKNRKRSDRNMIAKRKRKLIDRNVIAERSQANANQSQPFLKAIGNESVLIAM